MSWIRRAWNIVGRHDLNREIDEELQFHIDERIRENLAAGMTPAQARQDADRRFGGRASIREETREADVLAWLETALGDVGLAARTLRRQPAFALTAILTLALGMAPPPRSSPWSTTCCCGRCRFRTRTG